MENMGKALYMATGVLLFIMAMTSSVILYNRIIESANTSLVISDMGTRAESAFGSDTYSTRNITEAEVIASAININSLYIKEIKVFDKDGKQTVSFKPNANNEEEIYVDGVQKSINKYDFSNSNIVLAGEYAYSYDSSSNTISYKLQG